MVNEMIDEFEKTNSKTLGHGILPNIPVDHAKAFVDAVKEQTEVDAK
jgi:uroporphyrinogen decarboxylase